VGLDALITCCVEHRLATDFGLSSLLSSNLIAYYVSYLALDCNIRIEIKGIFYPLGLE